MTFVNRCALFSVCALLCSLPSSTTAQSGPPVPAPPGPAPAAEPLFEDVGDALGLAGEKAKLVTLYDLDRDGWPDITLDGTRMYVSRKARLEDGSTGRYFKRWAADKPLNKEGVRRPTGVHFADVNNDGRTDLYVLRSTDLSNAKFKDDGLRSEIWLGTRKSFRKLKSSVVGKQAETTITATFVDADHDGRLDLFTGAAYTRYGKSLEAFPDRLYGGLGDGKFEDRTEAAGLLLVAEPGRADSRRPSYGVTHADWNNDGLPDLFTMSYGRQWNRLWKNNGDGTFTDVAPGSSYDGDAERDGRYPAGINRAKEAPFRSNGNSFDAAIADYDHDGDLDLFLAEITHAWAGKSSDKSMLLENLGPEKKFGFKRHPDAVQRDQVGNRWNQGDLHAGWLDLDNDGLLDLLVASSDYPDEQLLRLFHQSAPGKFEEWTDRMGLRWVSASQISLGDFDRDGATDILVSRAHNRLTKEQRVQYPRRVGLLRNLAAARSGNHFFSIRLEGKGKGKGAANRDAIGARVTLHAGGVTQIREVQGGLGCSSHRDDTECRFGLGAADKVDWIEVRWPNGKRTIQRFEDLPADSFFTLREGSDPKRVTP